MMRGKINFDDGETSLVEEGECTRCGLPEDPTDLVSVKSSKPLAEGREELWCPDCLKLAEMCMRCGKDVQKSDGVKVNGDFVCTWCLDEKLNY